MGWESTSGDVDCNGKDREETKHFKEKEIGVRDIRERTISLQGYMCDRRFVIAIACYVAGYMMPGRWEDRGGRMAVGSVHDG